MRQGPSQSVLSTIHVCVRQRVCFPILCKTYLHAVKQVVGKALHCKHSHDATYILYPHRMHVCTYLCIYKELWGCSYVLLLCV
jgi:hypothetical protein